MLKDKMDNTYLLQSRRTEYLQKFQKTTIPLFIEGIYSIYNNVKKNNKSKRLLLKEFQQSMVDVSRWSQDIVKNEHLRFKKKSSVLDKLIRAIFDLDIILKKDLCKNAIDFIPQPWDFIHQCYLNIARALWKQPFLVYDINIDKLTVQQNKLKIEKIVSLCIQDTFAQYLPLDIEHDDISNIDYSIPESNQDLIKNVQNDVIETFTELNNNNYGDNNDTIEQDDDIDAVNHFVSPCNDNFKKLDYEINSNLHEDLDVFRNDHHNKDDICTKDNHYNLQENINEMKDQICEDYVNIEHHEEGSVNVGDNLSHVMDEADDISDNVSEGSENQAYDSDDININAGSKENTTIDYINDFDMNNNEEQSDIESEISDIQETKSFHSEEFGDIESIESDELFVSRVVSQDTLENNQNQSHCQEETHHNQNEEIKQIFIGNKNEYKLLRDETSDSDHERHSSTLPDVKIVNIEDSKTKLSSKKDALLSIKKKVKSSMHSSRHKNKDISQYERYGDKLRVERKNMSFF